MRSSDKLFANKPTLASSYDRVSKLKRPGKKKTSVVADVEVWSLKPSEDIRDMVTRAMLATGSKRQTLIFELIRRELPNLIKKKREERRAAEQSFDIPDPESGEEK